MISRRTAVTIVVAAAAVTVAARSLVPARFPAVDGDLGVRAGGDSVVATARWATDGPVPAGRSSCRFVLLVHPPDGRPSARSGTGVVRVPAGIAGPVLDQYGEVLPPRLAYAVFAGPVGETGDLEVTWRGVSAGEVRVFLAPVCPDTVHGMVELGRPR